MKLKNQTLLDIEVVKQQERVMFITLDDKNIVSYAAENSFVNDMFRSIGVETIPEFRNFGYAASNTAALAEDILKRGMYAAYSCSHVNYKSRRVAEKVGFQKYATEYHYICYKKKKED